MLHDPVRAVIWTVLHEPMALGISCILRAIYQRWPNPTDRVTRGLLKVVAISLIAAIVDVGVIYGGFESIGLNTSYWSVRERWPMRLAVYWLIYSGWSFLYFWIKAELASRRNRELALRAELNLLRHQLDPHFLFNTLNGLAAEIPVHPERALEMTRELADYLRFSLDHRNHTIVPLRAEVDAMTAYLRIEQARFGDQLDIQIRVTGQAAEKQIAAFMLQPLVENAVKHSLRTTEPPWTIELTAAAEEDSAVISVRNTGTLQQNRNGAGLEILQRRLALLYPGRHHVSLRQDGPSVLAELRLEGSPCA